MDEWMNAWVKHIANEVNGIMDEMLEMSTIMYVCIYLCMYVCVGVHMGGDACIHGWVCAACSLLPILGSFSNHLGASMNDDITL
jgi:hypothetical protein